MIALAIVSIEISLPYHPVIIVALLFLVGFVGLRVVITLISRFLP